MAGKPKTQNMALFCDFENIALGVQDAKYAKFDMQKVLERLLLKGNIVVKKTYCDWERYKEFKTAMHEAAFELIEIPHVRQSGKNSADIRLVVDALDRLHTTATSHRRVMVVEVMGRHAGWIALHGGIAGGADIILIPEIPFDYDKIAGVIKAREAAGCLGTVVVVSEGARPKHGEQVKRDVEAGEFRLGGIGDAVAREIAKRTGKETRCCVLGHLQRGGAPTTLDRILATRFGVKAVQLANEGHFGSMVSYQNYKVRHVPIAEAVNRLKLVPPNGELVQTARDVDISFGD